MVWLLMSIIASGIHARVLKGGKFDYIINIFLACSLPLLLKYASIFTENNACG